MINYLRNNRTGEQYNFESAPLPGVNALMPDYSQPIEVSGYGKGFRDKNDSGKVILADGRTLLIDFDRAGTSARQNERIAQEKALLGNELVRAQIEKARQDPKAPAGQRFTEDGNLEWIPGSPGDVKAKAAASKVQEQYNTHATGIDALTRNIDQLIGNEDSGVPQHAGLARSVGMLDARLPAFNQDQATAQALIKSLKDKSAISGLQSIRSTGTAPGSITEKEWPIFQNLISTLDPSQDLGTFVEQLKELRRVGQESKARAAAAAGLMGGASPAAPIAPAAPQYIEIRTAPNGMRIGKKADGTFEQVK